jgi:hypothetical protein
MQQIQRLLAVGWIVTIVSLFYDPVTPTLTDITMLNRLSERRMHQIKWLLAVGWTVMLVSLFYDPVTPALTDPHMLNSPFRLDLNDACIKVQGDCLPETPYSMTARIFWAAIVPLGLILIFVSGHEVWRRICPLSFFSQIPRALGFQRQKKIVSQNGKTRYQLFVVDKDSWLGKNYLYLQFALFFLGLNIRILFVNSDRLLLAGFLIFTILSAILVGYLFAGKSWCQYFCPMAPVQMVYTGTRGLLDSQSHLGDKSAISQSMCREIDKATGQEKSACVACQKPCIDIDSERAYWDGIESPDRQLVCFGYLGLVIGFYCYYFLYAGNWEYYYSGAWTHEASQLAQIFQPGWFWDDRSIPVPKLIAAPCSLAAFAGSAYAIGKLGEALYHRYLQKTGKIVSNSQILHQIFTICTVISWNIFWMFGSRPNLALLPTWAERLFTGFTIIVSGLWFAQTFDRTPDRYHRESLSNILRRQLKKLGIDTSQFLQRSIDDLKPDEIYVLAKVLPGFDRQSRIEVYQGVLTEALAEGRTQSANSLEMLQVVRTELRITPEEHNCVLQKVGIENPSLLDPLVQRSQEEQLRLTSYQQGLESLLMELINSHCSIEVALYQKQHQINALRSQYRITNLEQEQVLLAIFHPNSALLSTSAILIGQLQQWKIRHNALTRQPVHPDTAQIYQLLQSIIDDRQISIVTQLLNILELLADNVAAQEIARSTGLLAYRVSKELIKTNKPRLLPLIQKILLSPSSPHVAGALEPTIFGGLYESVVNRNVTQIAQLGCQLLPEISLNESLQDLLQEIDPITRAASLLALDRVESQLPLHIIHKLDGCGEPLVQETLDRILKRPLAVQSIPTLSLKLYHHGSVRELVYQQPTVRVGRSTDNDVAIFDGQVSRYHAILHLDANGIVVEDLDSAYGLRFADAHLRNGKQSIANGTKLYFSANNDDSFIEVHQSTIASQTNEGSITTLEKLLWWQSSQFFQQLNHQNLLSIAQISQLSIYQQGEFLCERDRPITNLLMPIAGFAQSSHGIVVPGQIIGETGILSKTNYPETIVVTSPTVSALVITDVSFDELLDCEPQIARALLSFFVTTHTIKHNRLGN